MRGRVGNMTHRPRTHPVFYESAMRFLATLALFSLAAVPVIARASTLDQLSFTGVDAYNTPYSVNIALDPTIPSGTGYGFDYPSVNGTVDGVSDTFEVAVYQYGGLGSGTSDYVYIDDASLFYAYFAIAPNGTTNFLSGTPDVGATPTLTAGSYAGSFVCAASLRAPSIRFPGSSALAMFDGPSLSAFCGDAVNLAVTGGPTSTPTSVTPEPSALALFATGTLGIAGVLRRRIHG